MAVTKVKDKTAAVFKQFGYWWYRINGNLTGPIKEEKEAKKAYLSKKKGKSDSAWRKIL